MIRCAQCQKEFAPKFPQHRFCSKDCGTRFHRYARMMKRDLKWQRINGDRYPVQSDSTVKGCRVSMGDCDYTVGDCRNQGE